MKRPRDPEKRAHEREHAEWGEFEVAVIHEDHGELGTLDETFNNDAEAGYAAHDATVDDVGITADVREVQNTETADPTV
jgi:hypothetical protein